ncbi:unnamed protein product [Vitrella brassicaformis CCMP3155]|uniref:Dickkopf N-terminal cysteine-rich domain-containing protein n=2 Tax=Vitrella brassicaformis TaxID=1169539 RepID=A0A0G4FBS8_VITBC|nr:unnamed protein product [Vitrella brassicaformis CCMP3155]|eukprot:CEM10085.1 unnamed protein product [Vitrella brassicaformis CCMP3155]
MALFSRLTLVVLASLLVAVWMPSATMAGKAPCTTTAAPTTADNGLATVDELDEEDFLVYANDAHVVDADDEDEDDEAATSGSLRALGHKCEDDSDCSHGKYCKKKWGKKWGKCKHKHHKKCKHDSECFPGYYCKKKWWGGKCKKH